MDSNFDFRACSWTPTIEVETSRGNREINLKTKHLGNGKIFLTGEITDETANDFVSEFLYLVSEGKSIDIYLNSPGGSVNAGLVIYDMIQSAISKVDINIYCIGRAASMGAVILAGGPKGKRYIMPHSEVMIHEPLMKGGAGGSATSIKNTAESILKTKSIINGILAEHTGKTDEEIDKATAFDNYMTAKEAIEFGLCDEIRNPI
ncbi:MAG: ATP-dependent Clp protease proteolytic subunit [Lachnospiraceae bacterium]|nr:ATP-dependent Clp protease proteolytic subunit [Lachnospiraceae bacterium]